MTIHHSTIKAAAAKGVILSQDGDDVTAHQAELNRRVTFTCEDGDEATISSITDMAKDAWSVLVNILDYEAEHPTFRIEFEDGDYVAYSFLDGKVGDEIARDPDFADLQETLELSEDEAAGDGEQGEDEAEEGGGSVVPPKYKALYAERGDATHCGDWLAITLKSLCRVLEDGKETTDLDRLETIANANDVAPERYGKLGIVTNGWQGRYRMTIRNMLTPRVAIKGFLLVPDGADSGGERELKAPAEWCAAHLPKKAREAAAKAGGVQSEPGSGKASAKTSAKKATAGEAGLAEASRALKASRAKSQPKVPA